MLKREGKQGEIPTGCSGFAPDPKASAVLLLSFLTKSRSYLLYLQEIKQIQMMTFLQ